MAVVEISRIQVRRGQENQTGIPTLAGGEFGWAADTEHLYIGLRRDDGGARDANVRILTENDLFNVISTVDTSYEYRANAIGLIDGKHITATDLYPTGFTRSIRNKEDDTVSIKDFGVYGDKGSNEDVAASFQLAINNLFLEPLKTNGGNYGKYSARVLHIPAGIYNIDSTIYIPKYTTLVGEGIGKTIINVTSNGIGAFQTKDSQGNLFPSMTSGISQPNYIHIEGMTIQYSTTTDVTQTLSLLTLDCSRNSVIKNVQFAGNSSAEDALTTTSTHVGITIRGNGSSGGLNYITSENVLIDQCEFTGLYHGVLSNHDIKDILVHRSTFENSVRGVSFNDTILGDVGPRWAKIEDNIFKNIGYEGIYSGFSPEGSGSHHVSINNKFYNVGNLGIDEGYSANLSTTDAKSVIKFSTEGNSSINDYFDRQVWHMNNIGGAYRYYPLVEGNGLYDNTYYKTTSFPEGGGQQAVLIFPTSFGGQQLIIKYNLFDGDYDPDPESPTYKQPRFRVDRQGTVKFSLQNGIFSDDYSFTVGNATDMYWSAEYNPGLGYYTVFVAYIPPSGAASSRLEMQTSIMM